MNNLSKKQEIRKRMTGADEGDMGPSKMTYVYNGIKNFRIK